MGEINISNIMKELHRLEIILLNLKIESARLKENNGIKIVADSMEKIIKNIKNEIKTEYNNSKK